jgi:hypothetical protein
MWTAGEQEIHIPAPSKIPSVLCGSPIGFKLENDVGAGKSDP